jgi:hypothetical protein
MNLVYEYTREFCLWACIEHVMNSSIVTKMQAHRTHRKQKEKRKESLHANFIIRVVFNCYFTAK